ncbi:hypothetical protein [Gracilimonas sp.]|uniref:hypothetical protein n=1 Tax=Gracilimonas sp. TaxID=1974203 RepID=UPI0025C69F97|nr:hypothetical protein [Gracilimonas sp.]
MENSKSKVSIEINENKLKLVSLIVSVVAVTWSLLVLVGRYSDTPNSFPSGILDWFSVFGFLIFATMFIVLIAALLRKR